MYFQSDLEALSDKKYLYINVPFVPVQEPVKKVEPPEQKAIEKEQRSKQKPFEIFPTLIRARKGNLLLTQNQAARQAKKQRSWDFLLAVPVLEGVLMYRQSLPH
jgi:type II secretory pathway component PulL